MGRLTVLLTVYWNTQITDKKSKLHQRHKALFKKKRMKFTEILEEHRKGRTWTFKWLDTAFSKWSTKVNTARMWVSPWGRLWGSLAISSPHLCPSTLLSAYLSPHGVLEAGEYQIRKESIERDPRKREP